jgi:hypothetical protein
MIWTHLASVTNQMSDALEHNGFDSTVLSIVEQAIALEESYKGMLHQEDEVNQRIQLLREALKLCTLDFECTSFTCD